MIVVGATSYPRMPKNRFRNRPVSSINSEHTNNIYIYIYTYIVFYNIIICLHEAYNRPALMLHQQHFIRIIMKCIFSYLHSIYMYCNEKSMRVMNK